MKTLNLYLPRAQYRVRLYPWARGTFGGYIAVKVDVSQNVSSLLFQRLRYTRRQEILDESSGREASSLQTSEPNVGRVKMNL